MKGLDPLLPISTIIQNTVYDCSRRSSTGAHGLSLYTFNNNRDPQNRDFDGQRILITQNKVYKNFYELISWLSKKTFINPVIDEGKGITIQRSIKDYF